MKRISIIATMLFFGLFELSAQAPSYVDFEWDIIQLGYANPIGSDVKGSGGFWGTEVRYNLMDDLSIGLGFSAAFFSDDFDNDNIDVDFSGFTQLSVDKYLSSSSGNRAFFGAGVGRYTDGKITDRSTGTDEFVEGESSFGVGPRIGYELGHFRIMGQYHYTFKSEVTNYYTIGVALTLWGGYKG